jgi:hypothetical protein
MGRRRLPTGTLLEAAEAAAANLYIRRRTYLDVVTIALGQYIAMDKNYAKANSEMLRLLRKLARK